MEFQAVSGPKFTGLFSSNAGGIAIVWPILDIFSRSGDIRDQSLNWSKIDRNFACFWPPNFFWGEFPPPRIFGLALHADSDHVAKFQGDVEGTRRTVGEKIKTRWAGQSPT